MLREKLNAISTPRCAVEELKMKGAVWVAPDLLAEVAYRGVTTAGELAACLVQRARGNDHRQGRSQATVYRSPQQP